MVKKLSSPYRAGRTGYWLKWKKTLEEDVVVMGSDPGNGKFAGQIGAIVFANTRTTSWSSAAGAAE